MPWDTPAQELEARKAQLAVRRGRLGLKDNVAALERRIAELAAQVEAPAE